MTKQETLTFQLDKTYSKLEQDRTSETPQEKESGAQHVPRLGLLHDLTHLFYADLVCFLSQGNPKQAFSNSEWEVETTNKTLL